MTILIINGPNLNFLGIREPKLYGQNTYEDLCKFLYQTANNLNVNIIISQSNHEGTIIDMIQDAYLKHYDGIIINPGAYTHYSYTILDALLAINDKIPVVEVHLTNILTRESFRKKSVIKKAVLETFMGEHFNSYQSALTYLTTYIKTR